MEMEIVVAIGTVAAITLVAMIHVLTRPGFIGSMCGGTVVKTLGVVSPTRPRMGGAKLKVHQLNKLDQDYVVIELVRPWFGTYESVAAELTKSEVLELRRLLERAEGEM